MEEIIGWKNIDIKYKKLSNYIESERNLTYNKDSVCFDICASISEPLLLFPGRRAVVNTGLSFELPSPFWLRVCDRSGLACNHGITTMAGIIDPDYRGEVLICLQNTNCPLKRYIAIKTSEVYVSGTSVIERAGLNEKTYHINETYLNVSGGDLFVYTPQTKYVVPNGNIFRLNGGSLMSFNYAYIINPGDRIAQMELPFPYHANFIEVEDLNDTERGEKGLGSSGK